MRFFDRLSKGWSLGKTSLQIIQENPTLMLFPIISVTSLILVSISFFSSGYVLFGEELLAISDDVGQINNLDMVLYMILFLFYLVNYFVIVFFNVGLVFCAKMILEGKETSVGDGIRYASTRFGTILAWAAMAATVGIILKTIQERAGAIGNILSGVLGFIWGIATFFVVPVIAYEDVTPFEAVKRSGSIMKEKWGESIGANFSFGLFNILGTLFIALPIAYMLGVMVNTIVGIVSGFIVFFLIQAAVSAANMVFLAAVYQHVNNAPTGRFEGEVLDDIFVQK